MAAVRMFKEGSLDWMSEVDDELAADMLEKHDPDLKCFPSFGTYFYDFNCDPKLKDGSSNPFADRRVRRAVVMAIDKKPIVQNVTRTGELVATTLVPLKSFPTYPSPPGIQFNIEEARRLLADAGYPNGQGFPRLHLMFNNDVTEHAQIAQVLRRQLQQNLNITLDLEGEEVKVFAERLHSHDFNLARASWYGDYYDPSTFTDVFKSTSDNNDSDWRVPAYDAILKQAESELDPKKRFALLASAENMLLEDAPIMPIFQYVGHYLFRGTPAETGIPLDSRQMIMLNAVHPLRHR
jgi:oligopeptide transport system substrate-binding protein